MPANEEAACARNCRIAEQLKLYLQAHSVRCIRAVYLEMYQRQLQGAAPMNTMEVYFCGNFKQGYQLSKVIDSALEEGYLTKRPKQKGSHLILEPTDKLIDEIQKEIDETLKVWKATVLMELNSGNQKSP
ncbi:MAG: hypothetical protein V4474_01800 [Patescibacteria group bacterium]